MTTTPIDVYMLWSESFRRGWAPIERLSILAAELFEGRVVPLEIPKNKVSERFKTLLPAPISAKGRGALFLAKHPGEVLRLMGHETFRQALAFRILWIIDSFWTDWLPSHRVLSKFDLVGFTLGSDKSEYQERVGGRAVNLAWGSDVLGLGCVGGERDIDIMRVGRQPAEWREDKHTERVLAQAGISFQGRPQPGGDGQEAYEGLFKYYRRSKFIVAHSNLAARWHHTHPKKEYITGRWTDALAAGASVAGVAPMSDPAASAFCNTGLLKFSTTGLLDNIPIIADAVSRWSKDQADKNYRYALMHLDWRWRLNEIADYFNVRAPLLERDLIEIKRIASRNKAV
ncbi:MAG: hypothetical protein AAF850_12925 [Pseudomonadota bacterium]